MADEPSFDYIVVGAGSAGCVVANRLSEDATVLLIEAGGSADLPVIEKPSEILTAIFAPSDFNVHYSTEKQSHLADRQIDINRGVVNGGCSSINGMIYVRGNRRNYDHWAELGNEGWSHSDVLPYFIKSENYWGSPSKYHGTDGPLSVRHVPEPSAAAYAFVQAAAELGYEESQPAFDYNGAKQEDAAGIYQVTVTRYGQRASTAQAFLDPVAGSDNFTVKNHTVAQRVVIENGRATGVQCLEGGESRTYLANREVVLSAGAIQSPQLLMLSGIGRADQLRTHGISPVVDLPGVGQNLQDHMMMLLYQLADGEPGVSTYISEAALFLRTAGRSAEAAPDLQFMFLGGMVGLPVDPTTEPNFLFVPTVCQPESRGAVSLRSSDPAHHPWIQPNYLQSDADVRVLVEGIQRARDLLNTDSFKVLKPKNGLFAVLDPATPTTRTPVPTGSESAIGHFVRQCATTVWHPVGTCKMGTDELAVVDPQLRVRGVDGLRVADASVMPTITSGNVNGPSIMIGEKAADMIKRR